MYPDAAIATLCLPATEGDTAMTNKTRNMLQALTATAILAFTTLMGVSVLAATGPAAHCGTAAHTCVVRADGGTGNG
jgi:hypothetical protein